MLFQSAACESLGYLLKAGDNVFLPSDRETEFLLEHFPSVDLITCVHFSLHRDIPEQQKPEGQHEDDEWWVYVAPFVAIGPMTASIGHTSAFSPNDVLAMAKHPRCLQCNLLAYLPDSYKKWVPVEEVEGTCKIITTVRHTLPST